MGVRTNLPLTPGQAVAAIASQAVFGDGSVTQEENDTLRGCLAEFPELWASESLEAAMKAVGERMRRNGVQAVLTEAVATVPPHLQQPLLTTVKELVASDGDASVDESELIATLDSAFGKKRR
ncbi:MAG: TerB family tellurite resistance protein [bacterium]